MIKIIIAALVWSKSDKKKIDIRLILKPGMFISGKDSFLTVICLIVNVVIIGGPKKAGYNKNPCYEGTSFFPDGVINFFVTGA